MPSKSAKQKRTMQAAKHNSDFAEKVGIPQSVAADFVAADKARGYRAGGPVMPEDTPLGPPRDKAIRRGYRPGVKDKPAQLRTMPHKHWLDTQPTPESDTEMLLLPGMQEEPDWTPNYQKGGTVMGRQPGSFAQGGPPLPRRK